MIKLAFIMNQTNYWERMRQGGEPGIVGLGQSTPYQILTSQSKPKPADIDREWFVTRFKYKVHHLACVGLAVLVGVKSIVNIRPRMQMTALTRKAP